MKLSLRLPRLRQLFENLLHRTAARSAGIQRVRLPRREVLVVAAAGVLAAVVTLIVLVASFNAQERRRPQQAARPGVAAPSTVEGELSVDDFLLPSLHSANAIPDYYPFRPRLSRWSRENAERFWVSPRQIATEKMGIIDDKNMESMFEKVK